MTKNKQKNKNKSGLIYAFAAAVIIILLALLLRKCGTKGAIKNPEPQPKTASIAPEAILPGRSFNILQEEGEAAPGGRDYDMFVAAVDAGGKLKWQKIFGAQYYDWADYAIQCDDGGILVLGRTYYTEEGQNDYYVMKLDASGNSLWSKTFAGVNETPMDSVAQAVDGGYIIAGKTFSEAGDAKEVYIARTDKAGNYEWVHNFGRQYYEWGYTSIISTDGSYLTVGQDETPDISADVYLRKRDNGGNYAWEKSYGGRDYDWGYSIAAALDGFIIAGLTYSYGSGNDDIYLIKVNENGFLAWDKTYGGPGFDEVFSICGAGKSGFVLAGATTSWGSGGHDVYIMKVDAEGNSLWSAVFGGAGNDAAYSVNRLKDGGYIIAGATNSVWVY